MDQVYLVLQLVCSRWGHTRLGGQCVYRHGLDSKLLKHREGSELTMAGAGEYKQGTQRGSCVVVTDTRGQEGLRWSLWKAGRSPSRLLYVRWTRWRQRWHSRLNLGGPMVAMAMDIKGAHLWESLTSWGRLGYEWERSKQGQVSRRIRKAVKSAKDILLSSEVCKRHFISEHQGHFEFPAPLKWKCRLTERASLWRRECQNEQWKKS